MALPNSPTARDLARLEADFASTDISNSHVTCSQAREESQIPDKTEGSLIMPLEIGNCKNGEWTIPGVTTSPNLPLLIFNSPQDITLSNVGQHSSRMRCHFNYQCNHFIYFNGPVPDGAVIYEGDIPFWHNKKEGTYIEFFGNPTGYIFLPASRDNEFLLSHRGTTSHVSHTSTESGKSDHD